MNTDDLIKNSSLRATKARNDILETLIQATRPICYDDFDLEMDKATFYRNISKFEEEKIVQKFELEDKKWYFEIIKNPHAHFLCRKCKQIECVSDINLSLESYQIESIILKGVCNKCTSL